MTIDVAIRAVQFSMPTTTGDFDIATQLGGKVPKACLLLMSVADPANTAGQTETAQVYMGVAMTDGTKHYSLYSTEQDATGPVNALHAMSNNHFVRFGDNNGADTFIGEFDSFQPNGVRINFTSVGSTARSCIAIFYCGADLQAKVGDTGSLGTSASTTTVTGLGFTPDVLMIAGTGQAMDTIDLTHVNHSIIFGCGINDGNLTQACLSWTDLNGFHSGGVNFGSVPSQTLDTSNAIVELSPVDGTVVYSGAISAYSDDGFSITTSASASSHVYPFLALNIAGLQKNLIIATTPTSTGLVSKTLSYLPGHILYTGSGLENTSAPVFDDVKSGGWSWSTVDAAQQNNLTFRIAPTVNAASITKSLASALPLEIADGTHTSLVTATLASLDITGYTYDYTATAAAGKEYWELVIEAGTPIPVLMSFTFADFIDPGFHDWTQDGSSGANYVSYLTTYYTIAGYMTPHFTPAYDSMLWMYSPYIYVFMENGASQDTESCLMTTAWDWASSPLSHKWSRQVETYRFRQDFNVSVSKNKVRGKGKTLQLMFSSTEGKDFQLTGWGIWYVKNQRP